MTTVAERERETARAKHRNWAQEIECKPMFKHVVTLDPCQTGRSWDTLSVNTRMLEFQELPARLHRALLKSLRRTKG